MSELGDEVRSTIEGAAVPVTLDELAVRSTRRAVTGPRSAPKWRTFVAAAVVTVLALVGVVVVSNLGDDDPPPDTQVAAPTVAVGDIDLAVLSTSFDSDGARVPIDPGVLDAVRAVPGVAGAAGAMQRFVDVARPSDTFDTQLAASDRSAIAISWEEGAPLSFTAGGPPQASDEIAINQSLASQYSVGVGDPLVVRSGPGGPAPVREVNPDGTVVMRPAEQPTVRVSGVFVPVAGDVDDINLVVMRGDDLAAATHQPQYDRIDIVAGDDAPVDELLDRVAAVLPSGTMAVPPSVVGFGEQLRSELEIQRAYHWLLDPDHARANDSTLNPATGEGAETNLNTFNQNLQSIRQTEFRVGRVSFIDNVTALVTVRLYFSGSAWNGVPEPTTAVAERVDGVWRISQSCEYAQAGGVACVPGSGPAPSAFTAPPDGWNAGDSVPGLADAYRVLSDPSSTVEQRIAVVDRGDQLRAAIEEGVKSDAQYASKVTFNVSAARLVDPTHAQVLYSVIADGNPRLETPYPLVGNAVLVDGAWKAASRYACGLHALATLACPAAAALPTTTTAPTTTRPPTTSTTGPTVTTVAPSTVPPTTDPDSVEVPTTIVTPTSTAP